MYFDDDVIVSVDAPQSSDDAGRRSGSREPLKLTVAPGAIVTMSFFDTYGVSKAHAEIWLSGPGVAPQQVGEALFGAGSSYQADTVQPFDILVFKIPATGQTAERQCLPEV